MLAPNSQDKIMKQVKLYSRQWCGWCLDAKEHLKAQGILFEEVDVGRDSAAEDEMRRLSGQRYVPTIVVDGKVLANFDVPQLVEFLKQFSDR
jgi:glutaredoxin-like YruB-family protein